MQRGPYRSVEEFLEQAVRLLYEQEGWLASHGVTIAMRVEAGWQSAARGEMRDEMEVRAAMEEKKRAWTTQQSPK